MDKQLSSSFKIIQGFFRFYFQFLSALGVRNRCHLSPAPLRIRYIIEAAFPAFDMNLSCLCACLCVGVWVVGRLDWV